jgi:hypothetical protein
MQVELRFRFCDHPDRAYWVRTEDAQVMADRVDICSHIVGAQVAPVTGHVTAQQQQRVDFVSLAKSQRSRRSYD